MTRSSPWPSIVNKISAYIDDADVDTYGDIEVTGTESASMYVVAGGVAVSLGKTAVGAALGFNYMGGGFDIADPDTYATNSSTTNAINVYIDNATVTTQGSLTLSTGVQPSRKSNPGVSENSQEFTASSQTFTASSETFSASQVNPETGLITFPTADGFTEGEAVVFTATGTNSSGHQGALKSGQTYYVNVINPTTIQLYTAPPGTSGAKAATLNQYDAGSLTSNIITLPSASVFQNGEAVVFTPPSTNYLGTLVPGQTYYVKMVTSTTIQLYTVNPSTSGAQPVALNAYDAGSLTSNEISFSSPDGFSNGEAVVFTASGSSYQGALADGQTYYVNVINPTTIQLYTAVPSSPGAQLVNLNANDAGTLRSSSYTDIAFAGPDGFQQGRRSSSRRPARATRERSQAARLTTSTSSTRPRSSFTTQHQAAPALSPSRSMPMTAAP